MWPNAKVGIMVAAGGDHARSQQQAARRAGTELTEEKLAAMRARIGELRGVERSVLDGAAVGRRDHQARTHSRDDRSWPLNRCECPSAQQVWCLPNVVAAEGCTVHPYLA